MQIVADYNRAAPLAYKLPLQIMPFISRQTQGSIGGMPPISLRHASCSLHSLHCPQAPSRWRAGSQSPPGRPSTSTCKAVELTPITYKQHAEGVKKVKRKVPAEEGEPPGINDSTKNEHLNWLRHWKDWCEEVAAAERRPPDYSLINPPPEAGSGQVEQAKAAKLLAFYQSRLDWFDQNDGQQKSISTQVKKTMLGFFEDLLAAQFHLAPLHEQQYALFSAADKVALKALARRIDLKVRTRIRPRNAYDKTLGAALTEKEVLCYLNMTLSQQKKLNRANIMFLKAVIAHMHHSANRGTLQISLKLRDVIDEELDRPAKMTISGVSTVKLLAHGFTNQNGGPGAQDKIKGKVANWKIDGFLRHEILELCVASKVADFILVRSRDLPLQPALDSQEELLEFFDTPFYLRHRNKDKPHAYKDETIKNVLLGGANSEGLEAKVGMPHIHGKLMHRVKHGAIRVHSDALGNTKEARQLAGHSKLMHEVSYINRSWPPKLVMAKIAGHRDGSVRIYRAAIWCSTEENAAFKGLFNRITPVSDKQREEAKALMKGHRRQAGVLATLTALRNYTDVILQDLVVWIGYPVMGPDYLAATRRFPFLAAKDCQHGDWLSFCAASKAKAADMRAADSSTGLQAPPTPPPLPPVARPVQQPVPVLNLLPAEQSSIVVAMPPGLAATIDIVQEAEGALAAPKPDGWTAAGVYAKYTEPLKDGERASSKRDHCAPGELLDLLSCIIGIKQCGLLLMCASVRAGQAGLGKGAKGFGCGQLVDQVLGVYQRQGQGGGQEGEGQAPAADPGECTGGL